MNIAETRAFLAVVSTKSISQAAEMLYLSQSTVSSQLKTLEEELGVTLVERHKGHRQINVTRKGEEFVSIAQRFMQISEEALTLRYGDTGSLIVSSVDSLMTQMFYPFFQRFLQQNSSVRLQLFSHQTSEIFEHVENRFADIGMVLSQRRYQNVITKPMMRSPLLYVQPDDGGTGWEREQPIHARHLDFRTEVLFSWGPEFNRWHSVWCNPNVHPSIQVDTITMLMYFLQKGTWTILPACLVEILQRRYPLVCRPISEGPPDWVFYKLLHRFPKPAQLPAIEIFERELDEYIKEQGYAV